MFDQLGDILLFGVAAALGAATITLLLIFLRERNYFRLTVALLFGMLVMNFLQGLAIVFLPRIQESSFMKRSGVPSRPALLALVGAIMIVAGVMQARDRRRGDKLNERLSQLMPRLGLLTAFAIGMLLVVTNIKLWALALATIETASAGPSSFTTVALQYVVFMLVAQSLLLVLVLTQAIAPSRSRPLLDAVSNWLGRNGHYVVAVVTGLIGLILFVRGMYFLLV